MRAPLPSNPVGRMLVLSFAVGVAAGLGAIVFNLALAAGERLLLDGIAGYRQATAANEHSYLQRGTTEFRVWLLPAVAALGGLLSGLLVYWFAREAGGHGTDSAIDAYHNQEGRISFRVPLVKIIASALTLGSGGSGGREGPIAQIGAGFGSYLGTALGLSSRERRILLAAGIGAGVGSIFHAPLAGALFAAEVFYSESEFEADGLIPAAVATIVGYSVFSLHSGFEPLFATGDFEFHTRELVPYAVLALVVTLGAGLFVTSFYGIHGWFDRLPMPAWARPMVGGVLTAMVGVGLYFWFGRDAGVLDVLSFGYGTLQESLTGQVGIGLLLALALGKMLTTSLSIGSGGSGGVFGPSMVIGGALGGVVGNLGHQWFPSIVVYPQAYVLVGMAGFFTAAAKTPISTIVMVSEMTGTYSLLVPSLWVAALAMLFGRPFKLYRSQVGTRLDSAAHKDELFVDVLEGIKVADILEDTSFETVRETDGLDRLVEVFGRTTQHYFPVLDHEGRMTGILSANDVRQCLDERSVGSMVIANDICSTDVVTVSPSNTLSRALKRFVATDVDSLPVVAEDDPDTVVSMLSRRHLIRAYETARDEFLQRRSDSR